MFILKAKNLQKEWNGTTLFSNVSFDVREGDRLALFGRNGAGKTSLLQGLLGRLPFEGGEVQRLLPVREWGWLDQHVLDGSQDRPLLEFVQTGCGEVYAVKRRMERLQAELRENGGMAGSLESYCEAYERYLVLDGYAWEVQVEKTLGRLNLPPELWPLPFSALSGGQKTRAQLASILVREPRFVLLDEPTNHLDTDSLLWLEEWARDYTGTLLYVSHDRTFIDRTATAVLELEPDGCRIYPGGYTEYRNQKELELRSQEALYKKQEREREELLESIRRYSEWFQQAHHAAGQNDFLRAKSKKNVSRLHAKETALQRLEKDGVEKPREKAGLKMRLEEAAFEASTLLRCENVGFAYATASGEGEADEGVAVRPTHSLQPLVSGLDLAVRRGDRIAVLGPNGSGKSTLLKLMTGQLVPTEGRVVPHPQTRIGYFAQELDNLDEDMTILDSLLVLPGMTQSYARTILGCFLFSREDVFKTIRDLSMGEKCRVAFLKLFFGQANLLVLDEPTNYLDVDTRERVEQALEGYPGAMILVTHDRYLARKTANRLLLLGGASGPRLYEGTYQEYEADRRERPLSGEEQLRANRREQLGFRLTALMSSPEPEEAEERERLMAEVRDLRRRIAELAKEAQE